MNDMIEEWRVGDMTATLTHIAGLLKSLPLDSYREALAAQVCEAGQRDQAEEEPASDRFRRARRGSLLAAVAGARDFVNGMQDALAHNRAAARADDLEMSVRIEEATTTGLRPARPDLVHDVGQLHRTFPGLRNVIPLRPVETLADDDEPA